MNVLDSPEEIRKLDSKNLSSSIELLGKQCQQVWEDFAKLELPADFSSSQKIVVVGMGGSTLGTHIVESLYYDRLKVSLEYINGYHLPLHVDSNTLVILSSYSGTTEEVLSAYNEASEKSAKLLSICSGGDLADFVRSGQLAGYTFEPKFNPSGQPRMGLGYSILSQILILAKLGHLEFSDGELQKILKVTNQANQKYKVEVGGSSNMAKKTASKLLNKLPVLLASEHLMGNIHTFANQINENAKTLSCYFALPEANHHLIEGLPSTDEIHRNVLFFFLNSKLYSPRVAKRYPITQKLAEKAGYEVVEFMSEEDSRLEQVFEFLTFGSWVSFYLAIAYARDPSPIPAVDFLKAEMAKSI